MIFLLLSIASAAAIVLIFRGYKTFGVPVFPAITINYLTAFGLGWMLFRNEYTLPELLTTAWARNLYFLGFLFIGIFYLMALVAQRIGVSVASIAAKMSMVVPIVYFLSIRPDDHLTLVKFLGLIAAIAGVVLASWKGQAEISGWKLFALPLVVLLGSGVIDLVLGIYSKGEHIQSEASTYVLSSMPFLGAATIGLPTLLVARRKLTRGKWNWLPGGMLLGGVNFVSIWALVRAIQTDILPESSLFPVNNVSIVVLAAVLSAAIFNEKLSARNLMGLGLGALAILLLSL